jgi:hypothetical protein
MSSRAGLCQIAVPPYYVKFLRQIMSHWHGPCPRRACEIMSSERAQKKAPPCLDTGTLM